MSKGALRTGRHTGALAYGVGGPGAGLTLDGGAVTLGSLPGEMAQSGVNPLAYGMRCDISA